MLERAPNATAVSDKERIPLLELTPRQVAEPTGAATLTALIEDELVSFQPKQRGPRPDRIGVPAGPRKEKYEQLRQQLLDHRITGELRRLIVYSRSQDPTINALDLLANPFVPPTDPRFFDAIADQVIRLMRALPEIVSLPGLNYAPITTQHIENWQTSYAGRSLMYEVWDLIESPEQ